jgi:amino acid adenylation domain-containing protein
MDYLSMLIKDLPQEQQVIRVKCVHPSNVFVKFEGKDIEQSIPDRFEQIVLKHPDRLAVKSKSCELNYHQLNQAANQVARAILERCAEGEEPIALLLEKDAVSVAAILGTLKAGKIYVPLDCSLPSERIISMLSDSQARVIVTDNKNVSLAGAFVSDGQQLLNIDDVDPRLSGANLSLSILPDALAYIIYTSGSTGKPKGVLQNHRNVLHNVMNITNALNICAEDHVTHLASFSTGQAVTDMYTALLNGAALYLWNMKKEGFVGLSTWLIEEKITIFRSSTSVFRSFVNSLSGKETFPNLRLVKLGSEPVLRKDLESYKKYFSQDCVLVNALSLTEARTIRLIVIDRDTVVNENTVPVGYAIADKDILLLDEVGEQVGFNEVGEIAVRSKYLSPGYWRNPVLTAVKFITNPNGRDDRIYLTGDLGLMRHDGCLFYVGRKDVQAKIRGHRVELGEIESALMALENVKEAAVTATEGPDGQKRLVGYIVPAGETAPSVTWLRCVLREKLPDYMIPSAFVILDALPLTPTHKVDKKALPDPGRSRPDLDMPFIAARTPVEEELTQIWAEVLSLNQVGINDNFLDLGGHSLAATQVISRVIERFNLELPLRILFEAPTVANMAEAIVQHQRQQTRHE